jgi:hypothetical protein
LTDFQFAFLDVCFGKLRWHLDDVAGEAVDCVGRIKLPLALLRTSCGRAVCLDYGRSPGKAGVDQYRRAVIDAAKAAELTGGDLLDDRLEDVETKVREALLGKNRC